MSVTKPEGQEAILAEFKNWVDQPEQSLGRYRLDPFADWELVYAEAIAHVDEDLYRSDYMFNVVGG